MATPSKTLGELLPNGQHHVPGYAGYIPQKNFRYGNTFGNTTRDLLHTTHTSSAQGSIFSESKARALSTVEGVSLPPIHHRSASTSPTPSRTKKAGYTGYIPRAEHFYGQPYADTTRNALGVFDAESHQAEVRDQEFLTVSMRARSLSPTIAAPVDPLLSMSLRGREQESYPLTTDQQKTGYTGYIPRGFNHFGVAYPLATQRAATERDEMQNVHDGVLTKRVEFN